MVSPVPSRSDLMVQICNLYYHDHLTMAVIGKRLGISRHLVGRLLREAINTGVVRIEIRSPSGENADLRRSLETAFGLDAAVVVDVPSELSGEQIKHLTCRAAAPFFRELLGRHRMIGVGWGSTTFELISGLEPLELRDATVVQITGGNKRLSMQFDCHEVTRRLARKLHVQPILLHAPGIVDDRRTRELLFRESSVRETFQYFSQLDLAIIGIGALKPQIQSTLISSEYISPEQLKSVLRAGAVGDVFSYFFDDRGEVVRTEIYERLITLGLEHIRKIPTTVGVATGAIKARAVAGAIRGGFVNTLIVDSSLARALLAEYSPAETSQKQGARVAAKATPTRGCRRGSCKAGSAEARSVQWKGGKKT